jgi:hypothetical protein
MTARVQTLSTEREVTERGRSYVNNVGATRSQQLRDVTKGVLDLEAIAQLLRHERFEIAGSYNFTSRDSANLLQMIVCDLATANDGDFKHGSRPRDNLQNTVLDRLP